MKTIKIEDFHIGFEYEQYVLHSERYNNQGYIWLKKTYTKNSARFHKIQKLIDAGEVRHVITHTPEYLNVVEMFKEISNSKWWQYYKRYRLQCKIDIFTKKHNLDY